MAKDDWKIPTLDELEIGGDILIFIDDPGPKIAVLTGIMKVINKRWYVKEGTYV